MPPFFDDCEPIREGPRPARPRVGTLDGLVAALRRVEATRAKPVPRGVERELEEERSAYEDQERH